MKTKLMYLLICLFLTTNVIAQDDLIHNKAHNYGLISLSAAKINTNEAIITLKGGFFYPYNDYFSVGLGVGFSYNNRAYGNDESGIYQDYSLEMPIYMNIRGNLLANYEVSPYYSLGIGYNFPLKRAEVEYAVHHSSWFDYYNMYRISMFNKGLFITPELGISCKNISLGVEVMYGMDNYTNHKTELYHNEYGLAANDNNDLIIPSIHIINLKITYKL